MNLRNRITALERAVNSDAATGIAGLAARMRARRHLTPTTAAQPNPGGLAWRMQQRALHAASDLV